MSIFLNKNTRVLVQGITGRIGRVQTHWMLAYGTNVVAGVTPGKGGTTVEGVPVFDSVLEAAEKTAAEASVFFVPAPFVLEAFIETIDAGIDLIVVVPEHIPVHDVMKMKAYAQRQANRHLFALGPTTAGILTPGEAKMGIMPASLFKPGRIGIVSRSGTLSYEMAGILSGAGYGQSTVVGKGADPVALTALNAILKEFENEDFKYPVLIHCLSGKDRTGIVIAALLLVCEIERDVIVQEYLLSYETEDESLIVKAMDGMNNIAKYFSRINLDMVRKNLLL